MARNMNKTPMPGKQMLGSPAAMPMKPGAPGKPTGKAKNLNRTPGVGKGNVPKMVTPGTHPMMNTHPMAASPAMPPIPQQTAPDQPTVMPATFPTGKATRGGGY